MNNVMARWGALLFSIILLVIIYAHVELGSLLQRLVEAHPVWLGVAIACFLPQILLTSTRWWLMVDGIVSMTWTESLRMIMAGKALNALLPSKLGEMSKAYFLKQRGGVDVARCVPTVVLEKLLDLAGLCSWMLLGIILSPSISEPMVLGALISLGVIVTTALTLVLPLEGFGRRIEASSSRLGLKLGKLLRGWDSVLGSWRCKPSKMAWIVGLSVALWGAHLLQIYFFFPVLRQSMTPSLVLSFVPLSLLIGLLPISMAGMGTRDTALILLFAPYADATTMAGVGLLCTMRYWGDTLLGVPFLHGYTSKIGSQKAAGSSL